MRMEIAFIILLWLALQIPLGSFIGDCIRFGGMFAQANSPNNV